MKVMIDKELVEVDKVNKIVGLMFKKNIRKPVMLYNCKSIHTFFMNFNIDVYFLDNKFNVIDKKLNVSKNKIILAPRLTKHVIEMKAKERY